MQFKSFMEALKGKQHKIDKNKNGEIDAHDFKLLRKEEEELGESEERMARADYKVGASGRKSHKEIVFNDAESKDDKEEMKEAKMSDADMAERERIVKGMKKNLAGFKARYGDRAKEVMYATATKQAMKEEAEQIDELSKDTLASYAKKATKDARMTQSIGKDFEASANKSRKPSMKDAAQSLADKYKSKSRSREAGIGKAIDRLAKEEVELGEAAQKVDIPAYLRKQQGQSPLKLSDLKRKDTISDKENLAKLRNEEQIDELSKGTLGSYIKKAKGSAISSSQVMGMGSSMTGQKTQDKAEKNVQKRASGINKAVDRLTKEELDEAMINGREYASHGLMHPDHAARDIHKVSGQSIDFYAHGTGDKVEGKVTKNDGKSVHIKDTKGKTHQFKVQRGLPNQQNEEKKDDVPFDGPYTKTKPVKNSDGTTQQPMSRARQLAKDAMKKQMKEDIDRLFEKDDTEYDYEGEMAVTQLKTIIRHAEALQAKMQPDTNLPEWVQSKITLATDYIQTASDYLHSELEEGYYEKPASAYRRKGDEIGGGSNAPVAPVPDRKYIKGTPEHKAYKATKKPINGMPTNVKESFDADGNIINHKVSYKEFAMMLEYEAKDGRYVHKGSYGGNYVDPEGADDADDKKPKQQSAEKRGRGRPAGAKSGARKITGTSKLFK